MKQLILAILLGTVLVGSLAGSAHAKTAIIIPANSPIQSLSLVEVQRLYMGKQSSLANENKAVRLGGLSRHGDLFCEKVLDTPTRHFRRHWIKLVFSGHRVEPPELQHSVPDLLRWMQQDPSSIAFVDEDDIPETGELRVLKIDGLLPGDEGYALP